MIRAKVLRVTHTLSAIFRIFAFFVLVPLAGSLYWDPDFATTAGDGVERFAPFADAGILSQETTLSFALTFLVVFFLGLFLGAIGRPDDEALREKEAFFIVGAGWLFCAVLGALPFMILGATQDATTALFESMSGITTTGFSALPGALEDYPPSLHLWRGTLHLFGGLGIVLVAVAVLGQLTEGGAKLVMGESSAGEVTRLRPKLTQTAKSLLSIYTVLTVLVGLGLWLGLRFTGPKYPWKEAAYHAIVHAFGTVATGGMSTRSQSVEAFGSDFVNAVVFFGMLAGGVGFALYYRAVATGFGFLYRSGEVRFYLFMLLLGSVGVGAFLLMDGHGLANVLGNAPFLVTSTMTTTGYTSTNPDLFPDGAKLVLLLFMFVGGCVGSTAGGIKVARFQLLFQLTYREITRLLHPHTVSVVKVSGRIFPEDALRRIVVFFFAYVTTFIAGAVGFALLELDFRSSIIASAATLGNIGYGFWGSASGFAPLSEGARLLATALMWLGRLEIFTVLLLFVPGTYRD